MAAGRVQLAMTQQGVEVKIIVREISTLFPLIRYLAEYATLWP